MRTLQVNWLELVGGERSVTFEPGLNVVVGPIATGKSTLTRLIRALFTDVPLDLPPEVKDNVEALRSSSVIGGETWNILRRLVTTKTAKVELVGVKDTFLLPASRATRTTSLTYSDWLLDQLSLPKVEVPSAPTRATSDPTPLSISDFLNYSFLRGEEIDNCVFGHTHPFRDIKRRYVFEIVYGLYDASVAQLQRELRDVESELTFLRGEARVTDRVFEGTELESIEAVRVALERRQQERQDLVRASVEEADRVSTDPLVGELRREVEATTDELERARSALLSTRAQVSDLESLRDQLRSQHSRIVRALVAGDALLDFEFVVCPRCGQDITDERVEEDVCRLCLQQTAPLEHSVELEAERDRLDDQIAETLDLLDSRTDDLAHLRKAVAKLEAQRDSLGRRLDEMLESYVSDQQRRIEAVAGERATIEAEIDKYEQYLTILERQEQARSRIGQLEEHREDLLRQLEERSEQLRSGQEHVDALETRFQEYVERLHIPSFGEPLGASLNRKTFLPSVAGRSFDSLSSQGLQVLVNIAHALAHHTVAIDRNLPLPGLLVIDGPSSNVGTEGYDAERLDDVYNLLGDVSAEYREQLQLIVVDNTVPQAGQRWVREHLSERDRLVRTESAFD